MEQLSKARTQWLEHNSTHVQNIIYGKPCFSEKEKKRCLAVGLKYSDLLGWRINHNIDAVGFRKAAKKLAELLGVKQNYMAVRGSGAYLNAIWGFEIDSVEFIIYTSQRGMVIQTQKDCSLEQAEKIIDEVIEKVGSAKELRLKIWEELGQKEKENDDG